MTGEHYRAGCLFSIATNEVYEVYERCGRSGSSELSLYGVSLYDDELPGISSFNSVAGRATSTTRSVIIKTRQDPTMVMRRANSSPYGTTIQVVHVTRGHHVMRPNWDVRMVFIRITNIFKGQREIPRVFRQPFCHAIVHFIGRHVQMAIRRTSALRHGVQQRTTPTTIPIRFNSPTKGLPFRRRRVFITNVQAKMGRISRAVAGAYPSRRFQFIQPREETLFIAARAVPSRFINRYRATPFPFQSITKRNPTGRHVRNVSRPTTRHDVQLTTTTLPRRARRHVSPLRPSFPNSMLAKKRIRHHRVTRYNMHPHRQGRTSVHHPHGVNVRRKERRFFRVFQHRGSRGVGVYGSKGARPNRRVFSADTRKVRTMTATIVPSVLAAAHFPQRFFAHVD